MALSFCSNWSTLQYLNPELSWFQQTQSDLPPELLAFHDDFAFADTCIDPLFEPNDVIYSDNYTHLLPCYSPPSDHLISLTPEIEFESYQYPKLQKCFEDHYYSDLFTPCFFDGYVPNYTPVPEFSPDLLLPEFQFAAPVYGCGSGGENINEKKPNGESLSMQSIAARQRRRKITEKTQELGKLIPGGNKMNTAEMFQAAFNYVKYLQAQVGILELMGSIQLNEEPFHREELQVLVTSPIIQEKLSSEGKCLVPEQFVQAIANDHKIQSNHLILKDIDQLIRSNS